MPDGSTIRVQCPLCAAEIAARPEDAGQVMTCDFCLEEFTLPVAKPAPIGPASPSNPPYGKPPADSSRTDAADAGDAGDDEYGFADEAPTAARGAPPDWHNTSPAGGSTEAADEAWLHVDEDLTTPDETDHPAKRVVLTEDYEFSGPCPLCGTRYVATDDQIGSTIRCPDCHSDFEILAPAPDARQPLRRPAQAWDDDEFKLSEPDDLSSLRSPTDDPLGSLADLDALDTDPTLPQVGSVRPMPVTTSWPRDEPGSDGNAALADAVMRKAEADVEAREAEETALPSSPLTNGVFACFADPALLIRWLLFAIAIQVEMSAFNGAIERAKIDDAMAHFVSLMLGCFTFLFGLGLLVCGSVTMLTITQDTASGRDRIESWPDVNFMDWFFESFYVLCAFFACVIVGILAGQIFVPFGLTVYAWGMTVTVGLAIALIFPVFLLATLETGLAINPFSGPVLRSLRLARGTWFQFSLMSLGLVFIAVLGWLLRYAEWALLNFVSAVIVSGVMFLYFRLLGRLTWVCQDVVADDDLRRETES